MPLTLITGGVRSGKSYLAVERARSHPGQVIFIATAEPGDDEMARRIVRHRAERPGEWETVEEPRALEDALHETDPGAFVIVDCLTLWVTNLMLDGLADLEIEERSDRAATIAATRGGPTVVVTNEVGSSVHPGTEMGRRFADLMGRTNTIWSERADEAVLMVMGRAVELKRV
jgi:adenosylcobinamide kinase / adenosylcobinamide-phosphate guanylyltransferase